MIIPAGNISSGPAELTNTSNWARDNNLEVNLDKSVEMVFVRPRSKGYQSEPPLVILGLRRVESIKMLGVTYLTLPYLRGGQALTPAQR